MASAMVTAATVTGLWVRRRLFTIISDPATIPVVRRCAGPVSRGMLPDSPGTRTAFVAGMGAHEPRRRFGGAAGSVGPAAAVVVSGEAAVVSGEAAVVSMAAAVAASTAVAEEDTAVSVLLAGESACPTVQLAGGRRPYPACLCAAQSSVSAPSGVNSASCFLPFLPV